MRVSRSMSVIAGVFALVFLVLAIALATALNRIEQLEDTMTTPDDADRDRQRLQSEIETLRAELEGERTKRVALEAALELARSKGVHSTPSTVAERTTPKAVPSASNSAPR